MTGKRTLSHAEAVEKLLGRPPVAPVPKPNPLPEAKTLEDVLLAVLRRSDGEAILNALDLFFESKVLEGPPGKCDICRNERESAEYAVCADVVGNWKVYLCAEHEWELRRIARFRYRLIGWSCAKVVPESLLKLLQ